MSNLIINEKIAIPVDELQISAVRSAGPGGQNVNKVSSKVVIRWAVGDSPSLPDDVRQRLLQRSGRLVSRDGSITLTSQRYRERSRNLSDCLQKLRVIILDAAQVPKHRRRTRPTRASRVRRYEAKRHAAAKKQGRRPPGIHE